MSDSKNDVIDALVGFGTDAVNLLRERFGEPAFNPTFYWDWERSSDEHFVAKERIGWNTFEWYEIWEEAKKLDSYAEAVEALEADGRTKGQLGQLVGTQRSQTGLLPERLFLSELVYPAVTEVGSYDLYSDKLRPHAEHLIEALAADTIETLELVQILGVIGGETETEVHEGVVFRRLTDDELAALLRFRATVSPSEEFDDALGPMHRKIPLASQYGLVAARRLPKVVGEVDLEPSSIIGMGELADSFVTAARLVTRRKVARGKAVEFSGGWKSDSWVSAGI